jgi:hypothetical protein
MDSICMQGSALGGAAGGGLRLGPRVGAWGVFRRRVVDGHGAGRRVDMGASGGTSLCCQSGKHFRELCWVGDCLIISLKQIF